MTNPSDIGTNREAGYVATGYRASFPLLVYARDCRFLGDIVAVPMNGSFLVSSSFIAAPGDPFSDAGAGPDYIGTKVQLTTGEVYLAFRAAGANEVIWDVASVALYRYFRDNVSGVYSWVLYRSLPQRALDGQVVFSIMDPDGVYNYYAQLMGAMYAQMQYDLTVQAQTMDADTTAPKFLPYLAFQYGLTYPSTDTVEVQRQQIKVAVPVFKKKGTPDGARIRIQALGYRGYAWELWINPGDPEIFMFGTVTGALENLKVTTSSLHLKAFGFMPDPIHGAVAYLSFFDWGVPTEGTTFHLSDGVTSKTFIYTAYPSVTPPGTVTWVPDTSLPSGSWFSMCYSGGYFIAFSPTATARMLQGSNIWTSSAPMISGFGVVSTAYVSGGNKVAVVGSDSGSGYCFLSVDDGATFGASTPFPSVYGMNGMLWCNGKLITVGGNTPAGYTSPDDGATWAVHDLPVDGWYTMATDGTRTVAFTGTGRIAYTDNGMNWTDLGIIAPNARCICWTGTKFVLLTDSDLSYVSTDGIAWTSHSMAPATSPIWSSVRYDSVHNQLLAIGYDGATATSPDGVTWAVSSVIPGFTGPVYIGTGTAYGAGVTVAALVGAGASYESVTVPVSSNVEISLAGSAADILTATVSAIFSVGFTFTTVDNTKSKTYGPPIGTQPYSTTARGSRINPGTESEYLVYPHGYTTEEIPSFVLSSRVVLFLANADGSPLSFPDTTQGHADAQALKAYVANNLQYDVLPVHVDVAFCATIVNTTPGPGVERLGLYEDLFVTGLSATTGTASLSVSFSVTSADGFGVFTFLWDFGDGSSSTAQSPTHFYASAGVYAPSVTVRGGLLDSPVIILLPHITVSP